MKKLLIGWDFFRLVRLLIGVGAVVQGIIQNEALMVAAGSWFLLGAVFNFGCCGSGSCRVPGSSQAKSSGLSHKKLEVPGKPETTDAHH